MIITIVVFILVLGILILVHELGHYLAAKKSGVYIEEFAIGFPPRIWSKKKGETEYSINLLPFGGYLKMKGELEESKDSRAYSNQSKLKRFVISVSGVLMNFILAWILLSIGFAIGMSPIISPASEVPGKIVDSEILVAEVYSDSAAMQLGLKQGDKINYVIIGKQKHQIEGLNDLSDITKNNTGKEIFIDFTREGENSQGSTVLSEDQKAPLGVVVVERSKVLVPWYRAPYVALRETYEITKFTFIFLGEFFKKLFVSGQISEEVGGPVAIYVFTGMAVKAGAMVLMQFVAILSINLGLINILPFPGLDGGRILFIVLETILRKKIVREKVENVIHIIGLALIAVLFVLITYKDIVKFINK